MEQCREIKGKIFDIQRFSFHDGDGIRTNVFFKGCTLNCVWCQNPEGISLKKRLIYSENKCIKCYSCKNICPCKGIDIQENGSIKINNKCELSLKCIDICPTGALELDSKEYSVDELVEEVLKDKVFFKHGGGVTVSGGEPLIQAEFIELFYKKLKKLGINTAIETALNVPLKSIERILPYLDQIYMDIKIMDNEKHKKYIGPGNKQILKNAEYILRSEYKDRVIVRTPMIPKITDSEDNIARISRFISEIYKDVRYEILNYNNMTESKYEKLGMEFYYEVNPEPFKEEEMERFRKIAMDNGVKNIIK